MKFPDKVNVIEVGPRDGLQSYDRFIDTELKVELIDRLADTGLQSIEVTSFVRPDVIPQLRDAEVVMEQIERKPGVVYRALVPNAIGARRAVAAKADEMVGLITASPTYNRKNQNMSIDKNVDVMKEVLDIGAEAGISVSLGVGLVFFCPYEGVIPPDNALDLLQRLYDLGARRFHLATSTGMGDPRQVYTLFHRIRERWPDIGLGLHLHNTNGMAPANVIAAMQANVITFETALGGLGGGIVMPKDMAVGNMATEDLVQMLDNMGIETGVDFAKLLDVAEWAQDAIGLPSYSFASRGGTRQTVQAMAHSP